MHGSLSMTVQCMSSQLPYTPCLHPWCDSYAVKAGRCKQHYVPWVASTRRERLPKGWAALRESILIRDKGICYVCGGRGADAVDHVEPGDDHRPSNLAAIHQDVSPYCHRSKTAAEGHEAQGFNPKQGKQGRYYHPNAPF